MNGQIAGTYAAVTKFRVDIMYVEHVVTHLMKGEHQCWSENQREDLWDSSIMRIMQV